MLFRSKVFRDEAVARRGRQEPLDRRLEVTAPHEWIILAGFGVAVAVLVLWCIFGRLERSVTVQAVLVLPGERHGVVSPVAGIVVDALVREGTEIESGQRIARVKPLGGERLAERAIALAEFVERGSGGLAEQESLISALRAELSGIEGSKRTGHFLVSPYDGMVSSHRLVPGQSVAVGSVIAQVRGPSDGTAEALAFVTPDVARVVSQGMLGQLRIEGSAGGAQSRHASEVLSVSDRPVSPPQWVEDFGFPLERNSHVVRASVKPDTAAVISDGTLASLRIVLERSPPITLLAGSGKH